VPSGGSLLQKCVHPFGSIPQKQIARHHLARLGRRLTRGDDQSDVECLLTEPDHSRTARQNNVHFCAYRQLPAAGFEKYLEEVSLIRLSEEELNFEALPKPVEISDLLDALTGFKTGAKVGSSPPLRWSIPFPNPFS
jgi:hypothetical protein